MRVHILQNNQEVTNLHKISLQLSKILKTIWKMNKYSHYALKRRD